MRGFGRIMCCLFVGTFACVGSFAHGETVRTIDDKALSGTIKGFANGELLLQSQSADAAVTKIPIAEIIEITLRVPAAKLQPAGKAANGAPANWFNILQHAGGISWAVVRAIGGCRRRFERVGRATGRRR